MKDSMKKYLPFVFPAIALLIVIFLIFRFVTNNSGQDQGGDIAEFGEGVQIGQLTDTEQQEVLRGTGDFQTVQMDSTNEEALGQIRYELTEDGRVLFSVMAGLPQLDRGMYQVWLESLEGDQVRKAFNLKFSKGGFNGSAGIAADTLPFRVVVSRELNDDNQIEQRLLEATIQQSEEATTE